MRMRRNTVHEACCAGFAGAKGFVEAGGSGLPPCLPLPLLGKRVRTAPLPGLFWWEVNEISMQSASLGLSLLSCHVCVAHLQRESVPSSSAQISTATSTLPWRRSTASRYPQSSCLSALCVCVKCRRAPLLLSLPQGPLEFYLPSSCSQNPAPCPGRRRLSGQVRRASLVLWSHLIFPKTM